MRNLVLLVVTLLALAGCGGDAYLKAQADAAISDGNARVAEAQAASEQARAVIAVSAHVDAGGAAAYLALIGVKGVAAGGGSRQPMVVKAPRDWFDYLQGSVQMLGTVASVVSPWAMAVEARKASESRDRTSVQIEVARQGGETGRIQSVAGIATAAVNGRPSNFFNVGGNAVFGSGTQDNSSHVDSHNVDRHDVTDDHHVINPTPICFGTTCK